MSLSNHAGSGSISFVSSFFGSLTRRYLSLDSARYFVASLVRPGDALCKPILPELWEPMLVNAGNWVPVLRGLSETGTTRIGPQRSRSGVFNASAPARGVTRMPEAQSAPAA